MSRRAAFVPRRGRAGDSLGQSCGRGAPRRRSTRDALPLPESLYVLSADRNTEAPRHQMDDPAEMAQSLRNVGLRLFVIFFGPGSIAQEFTVDPPTDELPGFRAQVEASI